MVCNEAVTTGLNKGTESGAPKEGPIAFMDSMWDVMLAEICPVPITGHERNPGMKSFMT